MAVASEGGGAAALCNMERPEPLYPWALCLAQREERRKYLRIGGNHRPENEGG
jgi:hypothetical protein